jgi:phage terminase large subunit-like protein
VLERSQSTSSKVEEYNAFTEALREGWLFHTGDAALTRHVMNAVLQILPKGDARFARTSQSRAGGMQDSRVIDALDAAAMANVVAAAASRMTEYRTVGFS